MGRRTALRVSLVAIVAAFALRLLFLSVALPRADPHDEIFHYSYAAFLSETGRLPKAREASVPAEALRAFWSRKRSAETGHLRAREPRPPIQQGAKDGAADIADRKTFLAPNYQTQHPPLFYLPAAGLLRLEREAGLDSRVLLLRLFAAVCAVLAIPLAHRFFRRLLPRRTALVATAVLVAVPGVSSLVGRITNDALALPLAAMLLVLLVDLSRGRSGARSAILLCIVLAAGCWTKLSFLPLLPAPLLAASLAPAARRRQMLARSGLACALAALLFLPWLLRQHRDTGDWLGLTPSKAATSMNLGLADRISVLPDLFHRKYWVVFGRTFLWAGTGSAQGAPALIAALLTAGLMLVWLTPALSRGGASPRVRRGALAAASAVALFMAAEFAYSSTLAAVARARGVSFDQYGLGWYAAILTPAVLVAGCVSGRPAPLLAFLALIALSIPSAWMIDLGVLPGVYSGRVGFNGANAPFSVYGRWILSPAEAMRTYAAVALVPVSSALLGLLWSSWQAMLGLGVWLGVASRDR